MHFPNAFGVHVALYGAWWCKPTDGVEKWNPKSSSSFWLILDCSITGEYPKISELPLQKISAVPRHFFGIRYLYQDQEFNKIGERTVKQTDWQKLRLYLATVISFCPLLCLLRLMIFWPFSAAGFFEFFYIVLYGIS